MPRVRWGLMHLQNGWNGMRFDVRTVYVYGVKSHEFIRDKE